MKNTNALQIFSAISSIIIIILVVVIVLFNKSWDEHKSQTKAAKDRETEAKQREEAAKEESMHLKEIIGHKDEVDLQAIRQAFQNDMTKYAQGQKEYRAAMANLWNELARKNEEQKKSEEEKLAIQANYDNLNAMYQTVVDQFSEAQRKAIADLMAERKNFGASIAKQREETELAVAEKERTSREADARVKAAAATAEEKSIEANLLKNRNTGLAKILDDLRRPNFDVPDGKILSVNQQMGTVMINLGSEDGLSTRMTFSVYDPSITGISFGADPEAESVICDVCKRNVSQSVNKAAIEVVRILGPHRAEARILDDQLTNPIVANDVIHTPLWKPGQKQHFALGSGMRIPGMGSRDGDPRQSNLREIMQLIAANGGIVDSYISDGSEEGRERGEVVGDMTGNTTYFVIGDLDDDDQQDQKIMEAQARMRQTAEQNAVRQISLRELLTRMAWKNVTPVRGFGQFASERDHDIAPTGEHRPSTGIVSPLYQMTNEKARVSVEDRSGRPSTGRVTGLYSDTPSSTRSTGKVSDLFRTRKPAETRTELSD